VAFLLQSPAEIHIVARLPIFDIEAAYGIEGPAIKSHVTTRNMLGDRIGEQDVAWAAGRSSDTGLNPIFRRR